MTDTITLALGLLCQFATLSQNPKIKPVITRLSNWVGKLFTKKSDKEVLHKIQGNKYDVKIISELNELLTNMLKDETQLLEQLKNKITKVNQKVKEEGLEDEVTRNIIKITGNKNIVLFDIDTTGDIKIKIS